MRRHKGLFLVPSAIFLLTELTLGVLLHTLPGSAAIACSYASVLLACAFLALFFERTPAYFLTQLALITTVCADYFLVVDGATHQLPAMLFFTVTQLAYFLRLYLADQSQRRKAAHLALRAGLSLLTLLITWAVLGASLDALAAVSMFYFANLALNVVFAFFDLKRQPLFAIGLLLFAFCDVLIGLSLIESYLPLREGSLLYRLAYPGFNLAWVFYLPAQALLALSLLPNALKRRPAKQVAE